jgi:MFS family permease
MAARAWTFLGRAARPHRAFLRGLDRRVHLLAAMSFLFVAGRMGLLTFLAVALVQRGIALEVVGLAFLAENLLRAAAAPLAGALTDRIGRQPVLMASAAASAIVMPGALLITDEASLMLWSGLAGLAQGPYFPSASSLLLDLAPEGRGQSVLAYHYSVIGVGYAAGVAPAGFLAEAGLPWLAAEAVASFALVVALAWGLRGVRLGPRDTAPFLASALRAPRDPAFALLAALGVLFPLGIGLTALGVPIYASEQGVPPSIVGLALAGTGLLTAILALPVNARIEATGPFRWLPVAAVLCAMAYAVLLGGGDATHAAAALALFALAEVLFGSALPTAVSLLAPPGARGAYQGAWSMVHTLGVGAALALLGVGRGALGWSGAWLAFAALTLAAGLALALARPWFRRVVAARAAPPLAAAASAAPAPGRQQ